MKSIDLEQNTVDWEAYRLNHIGSSDSPIILNQSKYLNRSELLEIKLGLRSYTPNDFITGLGHRFEPRARAILNLSLDLDLEPLVAEHLDYPYISASLDGIDQAKQKICELKYVGQAKLNEARSGTFDPSHYIQMQHQMFVSGYESCYYFCYTLAEYKEIDEYYFAEIPINLAFIRDQLFPKLEEFYLELQQKRSELCQSKDALDVNTMDQSPLNQ